VAAISKFDLLQLGVAERLALIEELWDSIAAEPGGAALVPLTEDERRMLDARLLERRANPGAARSWHDVRAEILKQR
jgi:putative addiction module component (TIGR02574 family)